MAIDHINRRGGGPTKSQYPQLFYLKSPSTNDAKDPQIYSLKMAKSTSTPYLEIPKSTENLGSNPQIYSQILAKSTVYIKTSPPPYNTLPPR